MGVFSSFRQGPTYRAATPEDQMTAALDMPMSLTSTLGEQFKGGILDSLGLGTAIREASLPEEAPSTPTVTTRGPNGELITLPDTPQMRRRATVQGFELQRETPEQLDVRRRDVGALDEQQFKSSPYFREGVKWDAGMTEDRAAALAEAYDVKRVRQYFATKRPITSFIGNLAGQAVDPINYIPIAGPAVKAANAARFGRVAGGAATGALDAAANTAIASGLTFDARKSMGDDITWQSTISDIAMAAMIGSAFGSIGGIVEARRAGKLATAQKLANDRLSTLRNVQDARVALNDAIGGLARGDDVSLGGNAADAVQRISTDVSRAAAPVADVEAAAVPQRVADTSISDPVMGFTTAKGSTYTVNPDGTTIRNKAARTDVGHEGDSGMKPATQKTVYVDQNAGALSAAGLSLADPAKGARVAIKDGKASLLTWNKHGNGWGVSEGSRDIPIFDTPAVGRYPLELWKSVDDVPGYEAYSNMHAGNAITEIKTAAKSNAEAPPSLVTASPRSVDLSPAKPELPPTGKAEAAARVAKPETFKSISEQYRVNPDDGSFVEQADIDQVRKEGRITPEDEMELNEAQATFDNGLAFGEALKAAAACVI